MIFLLEPRGKEVEREIMGHFFPLANFFLGALLFQGYVEVVSNKLGTVQRHFA